MQRDLWSASQLYGAVKKRNRNQMWFVIWKLVGAEMETLSSLPIVPIYQARVRNFINVLPFLLSWFSHCNLSQSSSKQTPSLHKSISRRKYMKHAQSNTHQVQTEKLENNGKHSMMVMRVCHFRFSCIEHNLVAYVLLLGRQHPKRCSKFEWILFVSLLRSHFAIEYWNERIIAGVCWSTVTCAAVCERGRQQMR